MDRTAGWPSEIESALKRYVAVGKARAGDLPDLADEDQDPE